MHKHPRKKGKEHLHNKNNQPNNRQKTQQQVLNSNKNILSAHDIQTSLCIDTHLKIPLGESKFFIRYHGQSPRLITVKCKVNIFVLYSQG